MPRIIRRSSGFTLIELLVVIAIAAILFPVFAQAREKARTTSCRFYAKQSDIALAMSDTDPTVVGTSSGYLDAQAPHASYIANYGMMPPWNFGPVALSRVGAPAGVITLAVKQNKVAGVATKTYAGAIPFYTLTSSSLMYRYLTYPEVVACLAAGSRNGITRVDYMRHMSGSIYVFLDGHAKWHPLDLTIPAAAARTPRCR